MLQLKPPATPGFDAVDSKGKKYQIKGLFNSKNLWSGFTSKDNLRTFDFLMCVIFDESGGVLRAHVIPQKVAEDAVVFRAQKKWWLYYKDELWQRKGVRDVTKLMRETRISSAMPS